MRINLTCVMLLIAFMQVSLAANAQKISLSKKNAPLTEVFKELRKQSGYDFVINKDQIKIAKPVTILVNGDDLINVLNKCFENQPFTYSMEDKMIIVVNKKLEQVKINAPPIDVKGRLVDENGNVLVGASIVIKGSERQTVTNEKGEFLFTNVDDKAILVISFIGYEVKEVSAKTDLGNISMTISTSKLDQVNVISTGYQTISRERLTGSVQRIDASALDRQVGPDILSRLESLGNGISFDRVSGNGRLTVRGLSSIAGPRDVLIVVDNFPYDGDLSNINPNDVESISVLKDASASSIWGTKAGNGVIVITTKKGIYNKPLSVDVRALTSVVAKPDLFALNRMSTSDVIDVEQQLFALGVYNAQNTDPSHPGLTPVVETLYNTNLTASQKSTLINSWRTLDVRNDFDRYVYRTGVNQQYSLALSGGSGVYNWFASAGYDSDKDVLSAGYSRLNLKYALNVRPVKGLEGSFSLAYTQSRSESGRSGFNSVSALNGVLYPYARLADDAGNALPVVKQYRLSFLDGLDKRLLDWRYYPLTDDESSRSLSKLGDVNVNVGLTYNLFKGFKVLGIYRLERQVVDATNEQGLGSYAARDLVNSFTQLNSAGLTYIVPMGGILTANNNRLVAQDLRLQGNYERRFGRHGLNALLGGERRDALNNSFSNRYYGYNSSILTSGIVDYVNRYPNLITGNTSQIPDGQGLGLGNTRFVSAYVNGSYDFDQTYYLYGSARRDASNLFGVNANDRWKPLWSVGLGWVLSNVKAWGLDKSIGYMKFRGSYGESGNADPSRSGLTTISYRSLSPYTNTNFATISRFYNPDLRWESVKTLNFGLDYSVMSGRLSGSVDYYVKNATDLFSFYPLDYTGGVGPTIVRNVAAMRGKGVDIRIDSKNLVGKVFTWNTVLNLSWNRDRIVNYYDASTQGNDYISTGAVTGLIGKPVYSVLGYEYNGLDGVGDPVGRLNSVASKDYLALTGSGTRLEDLTYFGSALPTWFGNLVNALNYKGFHLEFALSFKAGYYFRRNSVQYSNLVASGIGHPDYALRWQKAGDELGTTVPAFQYPVNNARSLFYQNSDVLVERGDHVRLQYINLEWSKPIDWLGKTVKDFRVFANCANVGLLWRANHQHIDPDYNELVPPARTLSIGIQLKY